MKIEIHPAVQRDVNEILGYYLRESGEALADRFFAAVQEQMRKIAAHPERFSPYPPNRRFQRAFIQRFPHIILFRLKNGHPRITAIKHQKRHPRRGMSRW
jgi:plasmid stabilization system protein ParE